MLRNLVDRALVGPRPNVPRGTPAPTPGWTASTAAPADPPEPATEDLEVDTPVPGSVLLDVREPGELAGGIGAGALCIPMDLVPHHLDRLPRDRPITVYCAAGARSFGVAHWLREQGFAGAVSLAGGIGALPPAVPIVRPAGVAPGTLLDLPATVEAGAWAPAERGEVILQEGGSIRCRVRDAQGFWVERSAPTP